MSHGQRWEPAAPDNLPEHVYRQMRAAILNGVFVPGQVLRQEETARQLGVSRAPLREALPRLEAEGIVVLRPRQGYIVASLNPEEIAEIFRLRGVIERESLLIAVPKRQKAHVDEVYRALEGCLTRVDMSDPADTTRWFDAHRAFHDALHAPANLKHFMRQIASLNGMVEPYIRAEIGLTGGLGQANQEHSLMAQLFESGDAQGIADLMVQHCEHTAARLIAGITQRLAAE